MVKSLIKDTVFNTLTVGDKKYVITRILNEIKGRMLEDIILLETKQSNKYCHVFKLQFAVGEIDMVVFDESSLTCKLYEIKNSDKIDTNQYRHLVDYEKCKLIEHDYGKILGKYVLYLGKSQIVDEINYLNAEEYLLDL